MKKQVLTILVLLICGIGAQAQDLLFKKGISLCIGGMSALDIENPFPSSEDPYSLSGIYEPTYSHYHASYPVFSACGEFILSRWIGVGADLSWSRFSKEKLSGVTRTFIGEVRYSGIYLMPSVRVYWLNNDRFKLYSGFYAGALAKFINDSGASSFKMGFAYELVPIGIRISISGKGRVYGMVESNVGNRIDGGRMGIGISF